MKKKRLTVKDFKDGELINDFNGVPHGNCSHSEILGVCWQLPMQITHSDGTVTKSEAGIYVGGTLRFCIDCGAVWMPDGKPINAEMGNENKT